MKNLSPQYEAAKYWISKGFKIFPTIPGGKRPATEHGYLDATTDPAQIDLWWGEQPAYNIGCSPHDLDCYVIDIDNKGGKNGSEVLASLERDNGSLPKTFTVKTPSGGLHLWYRGVLPSSAGKLGEGLDVRGEGGYVLLPGSTIGNKMYSGDLCEIVGGASWLGEKLTRHTDRKRAAAVDELDLPINIERTTEWLKHAKPAIEGQGGDAFTFETACQVRDRGVSEEVALDLMLEHWNDRCEPPWDAWELAIKIENAYKYGENEGGAKALASPSETFKDIAGIEPAQSKKKFDPLGRIRTFKTAEVDRRGWAIRGYRPLVGVGLTLGHPGEGKTFLELDLLQRQAVGLPWFGVPVKRGATFCFALEGNLDNRVSAFRKHHDLEGRDEPFGYIHCTLNLTTKTDAERALWTAQEFAEKYKQPLRSITFDTLSKALCGGNENDSADVGALLAACDWISREGQCFVNLIHHVGKDETRGARGWSGITGGVDTILKISDQQLSVSKQRDERKRHAMAFKLLDVSLGNDMDGFPITGAVVVPTVSVEEAVKEARVVDGTSTAKLRDIVIALTTVNEKVSQANALEKFLAAHFNDHKDEGKKVFNRALNSMIETGHIERTHGRLRYVEVMEEESEAF